MKIRLAEGGLFELDAECEKNLAEYAQQLVKWNGLNLVAKSTESDIFAWHIFDALGALGLVKDIANRYPAIKFVDFGAGGGVLGVSLLSAGIENIAFAERCATKLHFLQDILKLKDVSFDNSKCKGEICILARGVSSVHNTLKASNANNNVKCAIFFKANDSIKEINEAQKYWNFDYKMYRRVARAPGKIWLLENIKLK